MPFVWRDCQIFLGQIFLIVRLPISQGGQLSKHSFSHTSLVLQCSSFKNNTFKWVHLVLSNSYPFFCSHNFTMILSPVRLGGCGRQADLVEGPCSGFLYNICRSGRFDSSFLTLGPGGTFLIPLTFENLLGFLRAGHHNVLTSVTTMCWHQSPQCADTTCSEWNWILAFSWSAAVAAAEHYGITRKLLSCLVWPKCLLSTSVLPPICHTG